MESRSEIALTFKNKSDESFMAATECANNKRYRAACNRAWYATLQTITAGVYQEMTIIPEEKKHRTWKHDSQSGLFKRLINHANRYDDFGQLVSRINAVLDRRIEADYCAPEDEPVTKEEADSSIRMAADVRDAVYKIVGPSW